MNVVLHAGAEDAAEMRSSMSYAFGALPGGSLELCFATLALLCSESVLRVHQKAAFEAVATRVLPSLLLQYTLYICCI